MAPEPPKIDLRPLLEPRSIAVVGASADEAKFGGRVVALLREYGYAGQVFPVNARLADAGDARFTRAVTDIENPVDLVVLAIPADAAVAALGTSLAAGARSAIVYAGGFAETTPEGARLQERIAELAQSHGVPVIGPNSQGVANFATGAIANFSSALLGPRVEPGRTIIVSQSGLVGAVVLDELRRRGVGVKALIATGNEAATTIDQVMRHVAAHEPDTTLLLCLESLRNPDGFRVALGELRTHSSSVALLKIGRHASGRRAARSHTAAIASNADVFDAVCEAEGIIQVETLLELADVGMALARREPQRYGERVGVVSNSGGVTALVGDRVQHFRFSVPEFSIELRERLDAIVPEFIEPNNPLDVSTLSYQDPGGFGRVLDAVAASGEVDQIHLHLGFPYWNVARTAQAIADVEDRYGLPVLTTSLGRKEDLLDELRRLGRKTFTDSDALLRLARLLADQARCEVETCSPLSGAVPTTPSAVLHSRLARDEVLRSYSDVVSERLTAHGVRVPRSVVAATPVSAAQVGAEMGFPVVVKLLGDQIVHKSDWGGVRVGLGSMSEVEAAATEMLQRAPEDGAVRLLVQKQVGGTELLLAVHRDPQFGPVLIVGSGGVYVERLRDTATILPPLTPRKLMNALQRLRLAHLLEPHRGQEGLAIDAVQRAAKGLLQFTEELPESWTTFEINPLMVGRGETGVAWAVDYRAELAT